MYPAGEAGLRVHYARLRSGLNVRVVECGPAGGDPVLFIHGWGCSVYLFRKNLLPAAARGYRAIAVDLKGHGLSDKPEAADGYTTDAMAAHVLEIVDALALARPTLVGQSMGGGIALEVALRWPARIGGLVLVNPVGLGTVRVMPFARFRLPHAVVDLLPRRSLPLLVPRWLVKLALWSVYGRIAQPSERDVDEYWAPSQFPACVEAMQSLLRRYTWRPIEGSRLAGLRVPLLVVLGSANRLVDPRVTEQRLRLVAGSRQVVIDGGGHPVNEEAPGETNAALARFVEDGRPGSRRGAPAGEVAIATPPLGGAPRR
jgi:pimeloyl-ACP methyl ester carboxylesterase